MSMTEELRLLKLDLPPKAAIVLDLLLQEVLLGICTILILLGLPRTQGE